MDVNQNRLIGPAGYSLKDARAPKTENIRAARTLTSGKQVFTKSAVKSYARTQR